MLIIMMNLQWYFGSAESPFLQWVPSSGREPAMVGGSEFRNRLEVSSNTTVSLAQGDTQGDNLVLEQILRVERPGVHLSGIYTCKVATFFTEEKSSHKVIIFGELPATLLSL